MTVIGTKLIGARGERIVLVDADPTSTSVNAPQGSIVVFVDAPNRMFLKDDDGDTTKVTETGVTDHGALGGLTDDDHTQYALLNGRAGGQTLQGGTASGNDLKLVSTSNATKGKILLGTAEASAYDEVNERLGIGLNDPATTLGLKNKSGGDCNMRLEDTAAAHGMTALPAAFNPTPTTNTYAQFQKISDTVGGLMVVGIDRLGTACGILLHGICGTSGTPVGVAVTIRGSKKDGAGTSNQNLAAGEKVLRVMNNTSTASFEVLAEGAMSIPDAITAPATQAGRALIYVDSADGDLKVKFGDGFVAVIAADS